MAGWARTAMAAAVDEEEGWPGNGDSDGTFSGVVKSYGAAKGYGFIRSDDVEGDIYFKDAAMAPELAGLEQGFFNLNGRAVTFSLAHAKDGKPQAKDVQVAVEDGEPIVGQVKSFNPQKGFGFVTSSMRPERDIYFQSKDVPRELQFDDFVGRRVRCLVNVRPDGSVQAKEMVFSFSGGSASSGAWTSPGPGFLAGVAGALGGFGGPSAPRRTAAPGRLGRTGAGIPAAGIPAAPGRPGTYTVARASPSPASCGMGLLGKGKPPAARAGPYGLHAAGCGGPPRGGPPPGATPYSAAAYIAAAFSQKGGKGPPQRLPPSKGYGPPPGKGYGPMLMMEPEPELPQTGANLSGVIKSFDRAKGYGFINCVPGVNQDVYFKVAEDEVEKGEKVDFILNWSKDGKPQATSISRALSDGQPMMGTIKSFHGKNGYGFVTCEGHARDVYFQKKDLPRELQAEAPESFVGAVVRFLVKLSSDGKPQLKNLSILEMATETIPAAPQGIKRKSSPMEPWAKRPRTMVAPGVAEAADSAEVEDEAGCELSVEELEAGVQQVRGWIKSFNPQKGYGFINSDEVEGDVYFRKTKLPEELRDSPECTGTEVSFELTHAADGKPQAQSIEVLS